MKKKILIVLGLLIIAASVVFGISYALRTIENTTTNVVTTGSTTAKIVEIYEQGDKPVSPGDEVQKVVDVENSGTLDILLRVKVTKAWGDSRDDEGNLNVDTTLSTDNIKIVFNTNKWIYSDGYYYYKGILKPGEKTEEPLFESFTIDEDITINKYQGKLADILVEAEVVQASSNAVGTVWNKTYSFFGVTEPDEYTTTENSTVTFISPKEEFSIKNTKPDLFLNFKDLTPGVSRAQTITVGNKYTQPQEIFFKAEYAEQTEGKEEIIKSLLHDYLWITIKEGSHVVYDGPIDGNLDVTTDIATTMKDYISLGDFDPDTTKDYSVTLKVDSTMPNEYQDLIGNVNWTFMTEVPQPKIIVHHVLESDPTIKLLEDEIITDFLSGDEYTTNPSQSLIDQGFILVKDSGNTTGTMGDDDIEVTYYYKPGTVIDIPPSIIKEGTHRLFSESDIIENRITYATKVSAYKGTATITIVDTLPVAIKDYELDGGVYDEENLTITWTDTINIDTIVAGGSEEINIVKNIKFKYTEYETNELTNNVTGNLKFSDGTDLEEVKDKHTVTLDKDGKVIVHHYLYGSDDNGQKPIKVADDVEIPGNVGDTYVSHKAILEEYELVEIPADATGTIPEGTKEVIYYYKPKIDPPTNTIDKIGPETMNALSDIYNYTIKYHAVLNNYTGPANIKVTDTLEYPIDLTGSDLAGGTYDEATKVITWNIPFDVVDSLDETIRKDIVIKYMYVSDEATQVTNKTQGVFDYNGGSISTEDKVITTIKKPVTITVHHYYKDTTDQLAKDTIISTYEGEEYTTSVSEPVIESGYSFNSNAGDPTKGVADKPEIDVIYYYVIKPEFDPPKINKEGTHRITTPDDIIENRITYNLNVLKYKGKATVTIVDTLPSALKDGYILDGGVYDPSNLTITWTETVDIDTTTSGAKDIQIVKNIKFQYVDFGEPLTNTVVGTTIFDDGTEVPSTRDEHTVTGDPTGNVVVHHWLYGTGTNGIEEIKVADDVIISGYVGSTYETHKALLDNYELVEVPSNWTGTIPEGTEDVYYFYKPKEPTPDNHIDKIGIESMNTLSDIYTYNIVYNAKLSNYTGTATLTVVDQLPYTIDEAVSALDGGIYDETKKTITWIIEKNVTGSLEETISKKIYIKYKYVADGTTEVTNKVTGTLKYGTTEIPSTDTVTTKIHQPVIIVVNHYYKDTTTKVDPSVIISTYIGEEYKTSISQNAISNGYTFVTVVGQTSGIADQTMIEVNYYYEKNDNPYTGDSVVKYMAMLVPSALVIVVSTGILVVERNKRKEQETI